MPRRFLIKIEKKKWEGMRGSKKVKVKGERGGVKNKN